MELPIHHLSVQPRPFESYERVKLDFLDAFFALELQVGLWLALLGRTDAGTPFGQRIQALADHPDLQKRASAKQLKRIRDLTQECKPLIRLRNNLVHSRAVGWSTEENATVLLSTLPLAVVERDAVLPIELAVISSARSQAKRLAGFLALWLSQSGPRQIN